MRHSKERHGRSGAVRHGKELGCETRQGETRQGERHDRERDAKRHDRERHTEIHDRERHAERHGMERGCGCYMNPTMFKPDGVVSLNLLTNQIS